MCSWFRLATTRASRLNWSAKPGWKTSAWLSIFSATSLPSSGCSAEKTVATAPAPMRPCTSYLPTRLMVLDSSRRSPTILVKIVPACGLRSISFWNAPLSTRITSTSVKARTEAVRGSEVSSAISPNIAGATSARSK